MKYRLRFIGVYCTYQNFSTANDYAPKVWYLSAYNNINAYAIFFIELEFVHIKIFSSKWTNLCSNIKK